MKQRTMPYRIEIARWDPARGQIAADILSKGGAPIPDASLIYGFRGADYRDRILDELRGCYGTDSVFRRDADEQLADFGGSLSAAF